MAAAVWWTISSRNDSGAASNTRRSICTIMAALAKLGKTWDATSTSTTSNDRTRHWITIRLQTCTTRIVHYRLPLSAERRSPPYFEVFSCLKTLIHLRLPVHTIQTSLEKYNNALMPPLRFERCVATHNVDENPLKNHVELILSCQDNLSE